MGKTRALLLTWACFVAVVAFKGAGEARDYRTWCKSFATGENVACSTHTDYGGTYSYTPRVLPRAYNVPDNTLFNVRYEAGGHEQALFSMFVDANVSSCNKGANCNFSNGQWGTQCVWNGQDAWVCTIRYHESQINQYYLLADYTVRNFRYLALAGNANSPPIITAVPAMYFPENKGKLPNIADLWFYTGDDRTPKQDLIYAITNQTNLGVVSCSVCSNRYICCSTQPSANGFSDITFSAKDATGATASSTFRITITPANPPPSASAAEALPSSFPASAGGPSTPSPPR